MIHIPLYGICIVLSVKPPQVRQAKVGQFKRLNRELNNDRFSAGSRLAQASCKGQNAKFGVITCMVRISMICTILDIATKNKEKIWKKARQTST